MQHQLVEGDRVRVVGVEGDYRQTTHGFVHRGCLGRRNPLAGVEAPWVFALRAAAFVGAPYLPGGTTPHGTDCSGVVWGVFRGSGLVLPRWVAGLQHAGLAVPADTRQPGDLVLFLNRNSNVRHVGVLVHDDQVLHCTMTNGGAVLEPFTAFTNVASVRRVVAL
jgi:hypothetical protein